MIVNMGFFSRDTKTYSSYYAMPAGEYRVGFHSEGNFADQFYNDVTSLADAAVVTVVAGATTEHIDATLHARAPFRGTGSISGSITYNGLPALEPAGVDLFNEQGNLLDSGLTENGQYTFTNLGTGNYIVRANNPSQYEFDGGWYASTY
jgi:hypothetical protein